MSILLSWLSPLRAICMAIDGIAFSLLDNAYNIVIELSKAEFMDSGTIADITKSLYIVFGVVAFFRLAMVLINSMIDPEKFSEKGKGVSNIFFRIVGMIIILFITPWLFEQAYKIQRTVVGADTNQNIIFQLFLGDNANIGGHDENGYNAGKALQNIVLSSLITVDDQYLVNDGATCSYNDNGQVVDSNNNVVSDVNSTCGFIPLTCVANSDGKTCTNQGGYIYDPDTCDWGNCQKAVSVYNEMYVNEDMSPNKLSKWVGTSTDLEDENGEETEVYVYDYMFIVTGVAGIFMTYVIISFAIDIAVRIFELVVLQVLSPLFIATFVDPKSTQSGPFKNWLSALGKSYANLFIKLAILALMTFFIMYLNKSEMFKSMGDVSGWAKLFVIIGLLIFAKKAPKWISEILGIKSDGLGGLGIGKKLGGMALAGGLVSKGLDAGKKALGNKAKRVGAGMVNRIGADIGGTLAGRKAAKQNTLGDKSIASKRQSVLNDTGSKAKANMAAVKSFFSKDDRAARKAALKDAKEDGNLNLKAAGKEGRMNARINATASALDGKFSSAGSLYSSTRSKFDPNYQTHDQRLKADAEARYDANSGAFNMAEINKQKDLQEKAALASQVLGRRCIPSGNDIVDSSGNKVTFNGKTLKANYGSTVTSWEGMAAVDLANGNTNAFQISADVKAKDGSVIHAGSAVVKDAEGNYTQVASAQEVRDKADEIKNSYTPYGQKELEAVFAERKADNATQYVQTQQLANQTSQNIAKLELDLAPLTAELSKLRKAGSDMNDKLNELKKQQKEELDLSKRAELSEKIEELETAIKDNQTQQQDVNDRFTNTDAYLSQQKQLLTQINEQSQKYYNPDAPITDKDGKALNLANSGAVLSELEDNKTKLRKEADSAKTQGGTSEGTKES